MTSINQQVGIDFSNVEILLCCDLEESPLDSYDFSEYENIKDNIVKIKSPFRTNPGMSRQMGVDNCHGEYVMFCDADDCLYNVAVIRELEENIQNSHADVYRFKFMEEIGSEMSNELVYKVKQHNWVWVFDKVYKIDFLRRNNIKFSPEIRWHEDSYFNLLVTSCNPKYIDIDTVSYLWRYSTTTITRINDHEYTFLNQDEYMNALGKAFEKMEQDYGVDYSIKALAVSLRVYMSLLTPYNKERYRKEDFDRIERSYVRFIEKYLPWALDKELSDDVNSVVAKTYWAIGAETDGLSFIPQIPWHEYILKLKEKHDEQCNI